MIAIRQDGLPACEMAESHPVNVRRIIFFAVAAALLLVMLFEVRFVFDISSASTREVPDPAAEEAFTACYEDRDEAIHETAFGTIDNPDVQREFITSERAVARRECREQFPAATIVIEEPARFDILELTPRFW
jgi:hypothetical protein